MNRQKWAALIEEVSPHLRRFDEDAAAHALSVLPLIPPKPSTWRGSEANWYVVQAQHKARHYETKQARRGLQMRNGSSGYAFLDLDTPMEVDGDDDTWHSVIPGGDSPEAWLMAFEELETMQAPKHLTKKEDSRELARRAAVARWAKYRLTRLN